MIKEKIESLIRNLNNTVESIKDTTTILINSSNDAEIIAQIFLDELIKGKGLDLFAIICIIHEIIQTTASQANHTFIIAYGKKLKGIFVEVARHTKDMNILRTSLKILEIWETKLYYTKEFIEKLRVIIKKKINELIEKEDQSPNQEKPPNKEDLTPSKKSLRNSKVFLKDHSMVMSNELAKEYYQRKILDNQYGKYEQIVQDVANQARDIKSQQMQGIHQMKGNGEVINNVMQKLKLIKEDVAKILEMINNQTLSIANYTEEECRKWLMFNFNRYDYFEALLKKKKQKQLGGYIKGGLIDK